MLLALVFTSSWVELAALGTIIGGLMTFYHHIECHQDGCHRLGRFTHGHFKLCHKHHPRVPNDGKVTAEHIQRAVNRSIDH